MAKARTTWDGRNVLTNRETCDFETTNEHTRFAGDVLSTYLGIEAPGAAFLMGWDSLGNVDDTLVGQYRHLQTRALRRRWFLSISHAAHIVLVEAS